MATIIDYTYTPSGQPIPIVDPATTGFNGLKAEDFLKMMVAQLKNQDPTNPTSNEDLLNQISQMQSLQSSVELSTSMKNVTSSLLTSSFSSQAASLIGKQVEGKDADGEDVAGVVDRAMFKDGKVYLGIGEKEVTVDTVTSVTIPE
jgi:flagellar basal-body rod modification protein FlgD